jgi:hypothetical protein
MRNRGVEGGYPAFGQERGRAASLIFVSCAVGSIAGAGAVFSLVAQPGSEISAGIAQRPHGSVVAPAAAYSALKPVPPAASPGQSPSAASVSHEQLTPRLAVIDESESMSEGTASPTTEAKAAPDHPPAKHDPLAKASPASAVGSQPSVDVPPAEKKANKKPAYFSRYAWRGGFRDGGRWGGFLEERGWRSRQYW